jgi:hypothetical protein
MIPRPARSSARFRAFPKPKVVLLLEAGALNPVFPDAVDAARYQAFLAAGAVSQAKEGLADRMPRHFAPSILLRPR